MKDILKTFLFFCTLFFSFFINAQNINEQEIFENTQGIINDNITLFESEGYDIFTEIINDELSEKNLILFKKRYKIPKKLLPNIKKNVSGKSYIFHRIIKGKKNKISKNKNLIYYFLPSSNQKTRVIGFTTLLERDTSLEHFFIDKIKNKEIPQHIMIENQVDSIFFVHRYIQLGNACRWMGLHNIQCPYLGQMNWSVFRDSIRAKQMLMAQKKRNDHKKMIKIIHEEKINILFEGTPTEAIKTEYLIRHPLLLLSGSNSNHLIVYYVNQKINNKYISCVLSHFRDEAKKNELPPLLSEVMELK